MLGVHEGLAGYVLQHKVAAFDEAGHLILFVHSATIQRANQIQSRQAAAMCADTHTDRVSSKQLGKIHGYLIWIFPSRIINHFTNDKLKPFGLC